MDTSQPVHFDVQLSEPSEYVIGFGEHKGEVGQTRRNLQYDIITTDASRAIELVLQRHPQGTVHVVQKRGLGKLIFDPKLGLPFGEPES